MSKATTWTADLPAEDRTTVRESPDTARLAALSEDEELWLAQLLDRMPDTFDQAEITTLVYGVPKLGRGLGLDDPPTDQVKADQKEFFGLLYELLVAAERGPRLPTLFLALGSAKVRSFSAADPPLTRPLSGTGQRSAQQLGVRRGAGVAQELRAAVPLVGLADRAGGLGQQREADQEAAVALVLPRHRAVALPAVAAQHVERAVVADAGVGIDRDRVELVGDGLRGERGPRDRARPGSGVRRRPGSVPAPSASAAGSGGQVGGRRAGHQVTEVAHGNALSLVGWFECSRDPAPRTRDTRAVVEEKDPWPALFALCLGFFMILVDSTIVSVATPALVEDLHADVNDVVWVTSAYLLAYAVPVLITGRLGDRYGPKRLYLAGLTVFTLASLACGLTSTIEGLIIARVVQGLGASMITPQTMAIITRIFPAERRGKAMALWGATAGVATLVGRSSAACWSTRRLGVDLLHQHPGRHRRLRPRLAPGADPADQQPPLRLARGRAERRRHVPARLRHPGGREARLGRPVGR